jgi:hypothetical protein
MATWRELITEKMADMGESWSDLVSITLSDAEVDRQFDDGWGGAQGAAFTAWTEKHVYFPAYYDGSEWCASVPRNPNRTATSHVGGG